MTFNPTLATFSFFIFLFGLILSYLTIDQQIKLDSKCVDMKVQNGFNVILMLSIMMTIIPFIQLACHFGCDQPQTDLSYKFIIIVILILITSAGATVWSGLDNDKNCNTSSVKKYIKTLVISSSILLVLITGLLFWSKKGVKGVKSVKSVKDNNISDKSDDWEDSDTI
jgi:hypothetical protein